MVNTWPGIPAKCLCDKHLNAVLSEYTNLLMPSMRKGKKIDGYVRHGCVHLPTTVGRITECIDEAKKRGYEWKYQVPSDEDDLLIFAYHEKLPIELHHGPEKRQEMAEMNRRILAFRCPDCRKRMEGEGGI